MKATTTNDIRVMSRAELIDKINELREAASYFLVAVPTDIDSEADPSELVTITVTVQGIRDLQTAINPVGA